MNKPSPVVVCHGCGAECVEPADGVVVGFPGGECGGCFGLRLRGRLERGEITSDEADEIVLAAMVEYARTWAVASNIPLEVADAVALSAHALGDIDAAAMGVDEKAKMLEGDEARRAAWRQRN